MDKQALLSMFGEARKTYREILDGTATFNRKPLRANLGGWSSEKNGFCYVCIAGAYFLKKYGYMMHQAVQDKVDQTGMSRMDALGLVVGDGERLLDALRFPYFFDPNPLRITNKVQGIRTDEYLRRLGITLPTEHMHAYARELTPEQVCDRIDMILALNTGSLDRMVKVGSGSTETVRDLGL